MIPAGTVDTDVVKIVLRFWMKKKLGEYEGQLSRATNQGVVDNAIASREAAAAAAVTNAETAADTIT
jgi:hypothetical protein